MDSYPEDLLDGVSPLIFAVDTLVNSNNDSSNSNNNTSIPNGRSAAFETFFQRIAGRSNTSNLNRSRTASGGASLTQQTLTQQQQQQQQEELDPLSAILAIDPQTVGTGTSTTTTTTTTTKLQSPNRTTNKRSFFTSSSSIRSTKSAADFFQNSRLVPVSHRHSFPPSKDPHGNHNPTSKLNQQLGSLASSRYYQNRAVRQVLAQNPIMGILPSGWLEKHLHALPSTVLLVTELKVENTLLEQAKLEQHLSSTLEVMMQSGAKKRDCPIHLVCLIPTSGRGPVAPSPAQMERVASLRSICRLGSNSVTAVHYFETQHNGSVTTTFFESELLSLQKAVRDDSMLYYLTQVRRAKRKLSMLHHTKYVDLLPIATRYSIKIAIFYEFQSCCDDSRTAKSTKYWTQAYKFVSEYYRHLQRQCLESDKNQLSATKKNLFKPTSSNISTTFDAEPSVGSTSRSQLENRYSIDTSDDGIPPQTPTPSIPPRPPEEEGGVEVAIGGSDGVTIGARTPDQREIKKLLEDDETATTINEDDESSSSCSKDMIHQCRGVADWINLKLLLHGHSSSMNTLFSSQVDSENGIGTESFDEDANFSSLVSQIRKHCQVFLSKPWSLDREEGQQDQLSDDRQIIDPVWHFWYYVSQQRLVLSQFLERHSIPLSAKEELNHEALVYSSTAKQYALTAEALLKMNYAIMREKKRLGKGSDRIRNAADDKQRFVGGLSAFDLESKFQEECLRDHSDAALEYLKLALDLVQNESGISEIHPLCARLNFLIGGVLMKKEKYESAVKNLISAKKTSGNFPSLKVSIEKALIQCWEKMGNSGEKKIIESTLMSQILNPITSSLVQSGNCLDFLKKFESDKDCLIDWPFGQESSQPIEFTLTFPTRRVATEGDVISGKLSLLSNLDVPIDFINIQINTNIGTVMVIEKGGRLLPKEVFESNTKMSLPKNLSRTVDPIMLERQTVKGNRSKSSGFTISGGLNYECDSSSDLRFGGVCVFCESIEIKIALRKLGQAFSLRIPNIYRGSLQPPNQKQPTSRLSVEEDNYLSSAWERSKSFSLRSGPRCLRVLTPTPSLDISDLTAPATGGKAMEGTVNRILLKIKAGPHEKCKDLKINVTCSSSILRDVTLGSSPTDNSNQKDVPPLSRSPLLLKETVSPITENETIESTVPPGWCVVGDGEGSKEDWNNVSTFLDCGKDIITFLDLYRELPTPMNEYAANLSCQTTFAVRVSYKQIRPSHGSEALEGDLVIQQYTGTITWCPPLQSSFSLVSGFNKSFPSGIRHNTNNTSSTGGFSEANAVKDREHVAIRCGLEAVAAENGFVVTIKNVSFKNNEEEAEESGCDMKLVSGQFQTQSNVLFSPKADDLCHILKQRAKFNVTFSVRPEMRNPNFDLESAQYITSHLGSVLVEWTPIPIAYSESMNMIVGKGSHDGYHGPLPIMDLPPIRLRCPLCYIEATPFAASLTDIKAMPKVTKPFAVNYQVTNNTSLHQKLRIAMSETDNPVDSDGILVSGLINGDIVLGPHESKVFSYTVLVTKVGKSSLPSLAISSARYKTWVINDKQVNIFVTP